MAAGAQFDLPAGAARHVQVLRLQPGDAMVTAEVWLHLLGQLQAMGIHTLGQAREAASV